MPVIDYTGIKHTSSAVHPGSPIDCMLPQVAQGRYPGNPHLQRNSDSLDSKRQDQAQRATCCLTCTTRHVTVHVQKETYVPFTTTSPALQPTQSAA